MHHRNPGSTTSVLLAYLWLLLAPLASAETAKFIEPTQSEVVSTDGTVALEWEALSPEQPGLEFEVRRWEADTGDSGVLVYRGPDEGTFVSGLPEGEFVFKVRARPSTEEHFAWGDEALRLEVLYPNRVLVAILMIAGGITLFLTAGAIVAGYRRTVGEEAAS